MQWIFLFTGLLMLLVLKRKASDPSLPPKEQIRPAGTLHSCMKTAAQQTAVRGFVRIRIFKGILPQMERSIRYLNQLSADELLPSSRLMCLNGRFLQEETVKAIRSQRALPRLPRTLEKKARLEVFVRTFLACDAASFTQADLTDALAAWQDTQPLTEPELSALPHVLQFQLLETACQYAVLCETDQHAKAAAYRVHLLHKHGRSRAARKIIQHFKDLPSFCEALFRFEKPAEWMGSMAAEWTTECESLIHQEHQRQIQNQRKISSILHSLKTLNRMPLERILENTSVVHSLLKQDSIYPQMDAESRKYYREQAAKIAKRTGISEQAVCAGVLALCRNAPDHSIAAHAGYYLLDDGYPELLVHLRSLSMHRRIFLFFQRHACTAFRLFAWFFFFVLLVLGFRWRLPIVLLVPFAFLMGLAAQQAALRLLPSKNRRTPRMSIHQLSADERTLVVCPVVLSSAQEALSAVKHLAVMHEANPDDQLHFLLLGDFQDSLTATLSTDAEIIAAASSAIKALCGDSGHPFFYLQRERIFSSTEKNHHSRERKRGALETILRLICGRAIQDRFAFASFDLSSLKGYYRYVITVDSDTILPPGSALRMAGAMMHPLQKRQMWNGRMRGASLLQPRMETAFHAFITNFSRLISSDERRHFANDIDRLFSSGTFEGNGMIDPEPFLDETISALPEGRILNHPLIEGALAGCAHADEIQLYRGVSANLKQWGHQLHKHTRGAWQNLPYLIPLIGYAGRKPLKSAERFKIWHDAMLALAAPVQLLLLLYAAAKGRELLTAAVALLPGVSLLLTRSRRSVPQFLSRLALLPCEAYIHADAIVRTLYRLVISHQHLLEDAPAAQLTHSKSEPSMLFFTLNMTCAGLCAAFALLFDGAFVGLALALLWAAFPFLLPALEQERSGSQQLTSYMRDVLMRLAQNTFTFFETAITEKDHALPPEDVQIEPNKGFSHATTPAAIGLYLCSLIAAEKLGLLPTQDMAERMDETVHTLEALPKWQGLLYDRYDTCTLAPLSPLHISSEECGILAVSLLTCAQGMWALKTEDTYALSERLDRLCAGMQLARLYDPEAGLFFTGADLTSGTPSADHFDLLASESRLLSYVSIMLGQVPLSHWHRLSRQQTSRGVLLSQNGGMSEYQLPLLFQPLVPDTLLEHASSKFFAAQRRHRLGKAYGVSKCAYHQFDPALRYRRKAFGLSEFALDADVENNVLSPYASLLCISMDAKSVFRNLQRLQILGLEGPLGLFEAADFSKTDGGKMRIVRSHTSAHQGMILCALCNALADGYLTSLFSSLPRAQAYRLLMEEPFIRQRPLIRHPLRCSFKEHAKDDAAMQRHAQALTLPVDAHLLCGGDTTLLIDAQGGGFLRHGRTMLTRFHENCSQPSGMRIYLRDSQSGAYWMVTDPYLTQTVRFETAQAVFTAERFDIYSELRVWIDPLTGSCIHYLTLENTAGSERVMEVCSYLEPEFNSSSVQTERLDQFGASAKIGDDSVLWHLMSSDTPISAFRIQTDRAVFLGRGRSIYAPRAMELPIGALGDSIGRMTDPCLSLRGQFSLPPKGTAEFFFVTCLAGEKEDILAFSSRHLQPDELLLSFDSALTRGIAIARYLRLGSIEQETISRMIGCLVYTGQYTQGELPSNSPSALEETESDVPVLLYLCLGSINEPLLKLLLNAHAMYRMNGLETELVILTEDAAHPAELALEAETVVLASHSARWLEQKGGVRLLTKPSEDEKRFLRQTARLIITSAGGTIDQQLNELMCSVRARSLYVCRSGAQWRQQLPSSEPLLLENGYGGFLAETGDYQILLPPGRYTPSPWRNLLCCSSSFCTWACETGLLSACAGGKRFSASADDPLTPVDGESFYLRDQEQRLLWSITRLPLGHQTTVRITHAPGAVTYESSGYGIYTRMHCFTAAHLPAGIRSIHLQNDSQTERTLTFFHTCHLTSSLSSDLQCGNDRISGRLSQPNGWFALCAVDAEKVSTSLMTAGQFHGLWSPVPFALSSMEKLPQSTGDTAILSCTVRLKPGESRTLTTALVCGHSEAFLQEAIRELRASSALDHLRDVRRLWEERLGVLQFDLPDQALTIMLNRWLRFQVHAGNMLSSSNQLTIQLPLLLTHPEEAREHILRCASDMHTPKEALLLSYVGACYVESTGDSSILQPIASGTNESILMRCLRILDSVEYGAHDLPLAEEGGFESVCMGMFACEVIRRLAPMCGENRQAQLNQRRELLLAAIERFAWDGAWYLRGWDQDGNKVGSAQSEENKIDLSSQSWAVICGAARERCEIAMESVWHSITASANQRNLNVQTVCMVISTLHQLGQDERAWQLIGNLLPTTHTSSRTSAVRYRAEPYLMAEEMHTGIRPKNPNEWHTDGAAAFLSVAVHELLGLMKQGDELRFRPVVPAKWDLLRVTYRFGSATYHLRASRACQQPTADGKPLANGALKLVDDGRVHEAIFPLR